MGKNFQEKFKNFSQRKYGKTNLGFVDFALSGTELKILISLYKFSSNLNIAATFPHL